jgi:hypothetical protein
VSYEYPTRYRNLIRAGERFVYYRGRRTSAGPNQPQAYLGVGIIGAISPAPDRRLRCAIEDYRPFAEPLPFRHADEYYETRAAGRGSQTGLYFRQGARMLTEAEYSTIVRAARFVNETPIDEDSPAYANARTAAALEAVSVALAVNEAQRRFPGADVQPMPHSNPGFDILINLPSGARYVEVKGTLGARSRFFMSEGERQFSEANADRYSLWVYCDVDLETETGRLVERDGALSGSDVALIPHQWRGEVL